MAVVCGQPGVDLSDIPQLVAIGPEAAEPARRAAGVSATIGNSIFEQEASANGQSVEGLAEWLTRLNLAVYEEPARRWCQEKQVTAVHGLSEHWEVFCNDLGMKPLQCKRVRESVVGQHFQLVLPVQPVYPVQPEQVVLKAKVAVRTSQGAGDPSTFGPPEDPYTISRFVGSGATARVYECSRGGQAFAAKVIDLAKLRSQPHFSENLMKLKRETEILFNVRHPRIVSLFNTYETEDHLILVLEFVQGGELFDHMSAVGRLSEADARDVFLQLVDALTYMQGEGVVHRDLKLENILVYSQPPTGRLEVKVSDFGHSKIIKEGMSIARTMVGTRHYWAPEVALLPTAAGYDFSVDLWSLGVVLYVMLEGVYPFDGPQMADQIRRADVQFGPDSQVPTAAQDIIKLLIQKDPKSRLSLSGCLQHPWCRGATPAPAAAAPAREERTSGGRT